MKIVFLMPGVARCPMGGFKVIFEYANRLAQDGYQVTILLPTSLLTGRKTIKGLFRKWLRFFLYLFIKEAKPISWFEMDKRIKFKVIPSLHQTYATKADIYVATAMQTAIYLNKYKNKGKKIYFIQGYEFWGMGEEKLLETYQYDMQKIVVSTYLKNKVEKIGQTAILIPNGFDFTKFSTTKDIDSRNKLNLGTMFHLDPLKGFWDVKKAIAMVHEQYPDVVLNVFGTQPNTFKESYINYVTNPNPQTLCNLYNDCSIFVAASHSEGFGLTIGEAMICSAAVVCTDTGGYLEMAQNEKTALISPVGHIERLAQNIIKLISNDKLRTEIALEGHQKIATFTWNSSYLKLKAELEN